jgi:hypothetical protein
VKPADYFERRNPYAHENYIGLCALQATQLSNNKRQEKAPRPHGSKEVLPFLQFAY